MNEEKQNVATEGDNVPFRVFDFSAGPEPRAGVGLGYFYDIPVEGEDIGGVLQFMRGPFPTAIAARDAAVAFITDALSEHQGEEAKWQGDLPVGDTEIASSESLMDVSDEEIDFEEEKVN